MKNKPQRLTGKQERFCRHYLDTDGNASEAYRMRYVEGCGVANARTAVQMYGRCVEATLSGECRQFTPVEKQKPA